MRRLAATLMVLVVAQWTNSARGQTSAGQRTPTSQKTSEQSDAAAIYQRLAALEAQNAQLRQSLQELNESVRVSRLKREPRPVHEARLDTNIPGQLGRPLPPGRDVVRDDDEPTGWTGGGPRSRPAWGWSNPSFDLGGYSTHRCRLRFATGGPFGGRGW